MLVRPPKSLRHAIHLAFSGALLATPLAASLLALPAWAQNVEAEYAFNIGAGPLEAAIIEFSSVAGVTVSFEPAVVSGRQSSGLQGRYGASQALQHLLHGSGLQAVPQAGGSYSLLPVSAQDEALQLGATSVIGSGLGSTTEGSGSYTTGAMQTATKLPLSIRETPQSVTVVTRQQMDEQNITSVAEVLERTTGTTVSKTESDRHYIYARGFAITQLQYDGIPTRDNGFGYETDLLSDASIYDRVEIVRGATGLLSGSGEPSAAINLVRKRPTHEFQGHAQVSAGRWDNYRSEVDLSGPLSAEGRLRGRFVGTYGDSHSNLDHHQKDLTGLYGILEADLTDSTLLTVGADYQNSHASGVTYGSPVPMFYANGQRTHFSRSTTTASDWTSLNKTKRTIFTSLEQKLGDDWQAKLQYTHRDVEADPKLLYMSGFPDRSTGEGVGVFATSYDIDTTQDAVDVYANGLFPMLGREHELVLGYSYNLYSAKYQWHPLLNLASLDSFYDRDNYPEPVFGQGYNRKRDSEWRETGAYVASRWSLADSLKLITGLRVTDSDFNEEFAANNTSVRYSSELTPYAGLVYDLSSNHSVYVSYTDIFQIQTNRDRSGTVLDPITGTNYEAGIKSEFYDGRLNLSAALFKVKQDNLAEFDTVVDGQNRYRAIKGASVRGYELEISGELAPGWNIAGGFTRRIAKNASGASIQTIEPQSLLRLTSSYRLPGELNAITLGGHATWQNRTYEKNVRPGGGDAVQNNYELLHLFATYQATQSLSVQANLNNVFDKVYYSGVVNGYGMYGEPRNLTLTTKYSF